MYCVVCCLFVCLLKYFASAPFVSSVAGVNDPLGATPMMGLTTGGVVETLKHRVINVLLSWLHHFYTVPSFWGAFDSGAAKLGLQPGDLVRFPKSKSGVLLVLSSWAIEALRDLPPNVFVTGLVLPSKVTSPLPDWLTQWVDADHEGPVVYVSLGTTTSVSRRDRDSLLQIFRAFPNTRFLWKVKDEREPGPNVKTASWFPQNDLLSSQRITVFITHGGMNSFGEALWHGVPMLVLPLFGDQPENAATASRLGVGRSVHLRDSNMVAAAIEALTDIFQNISSYRAAVMRVSRILHSENGPKRAIDVMEQIHQSGGADHLVPHYSQKSFIVRHAIDAMALITLIVLLLMYTVIRAATACICCCSRKSKPKTQ